MVNLSYMKKFLNFVLVGAIILLALPYLSTGTSVFMAKWAYDWGLPVPAVKLILLAGAAMILLVIFKIVKKAVVLTVVAILIMIGLNALGLYNMKTDPKDIVTQVTVVAEENSETIVTATRDLFYQAVAYTTAVNPVETVMDFANGGNSFWYLATSSDKVDLSQEIFQGYRVAEIKEVGNFKAYHLVKN